MANSSEITTTSIYSEQEQWREIGHLDIDAFDVQVWTKDKPWLKSVPLVVVNSWKTILAVNYPAKALGIDRRMDKKLSVAKQKCPELFAFEVPNRWGKPDQRTARLCSYEIYDCIKKYFNNCGCDVKIDYSSKDEFFFDLSELVSLQIATGQKLQYSDFHHKTILETHQETVSTELETYLREHGEKPVDSCSGEKRLLFAAAIVGKLVEFLKSNTGFESSAGVGVNKLQAKLACGHNKPNAITAFMDPAMEYVSKNIKIKDINGLGGIKGKRIMEFFSGAENGEPGPTMTMHQLRSIPQVLLVREFDENFAIKVRNWAMGIDSTPVLNKSTKDSISIERKIFSSKSLRSVNELKEVIHNFCEELIERLAEEKSRNVRRVKLGKLILTRPKVEGEKRLIDSGSFSCPVVPTVENIYEKVMQMLENNWAEKGQPPIEEITKVKMVATDFVLIED